MRSEVLLFNLDENSWQAFLPFQNCFNHTIMLKYEFSVLKGEGIRQVFGKRRKSFLFESAEELNSPLKKKGGLQGKSWISFLSTSRGWGVKRVCKKKRRVSILTLLKTHGNHRPEKVMILQKGNIFMSLIHLSVMQSSPWFAWELKREADHFSLYSFWHWLVRGLFTEKNNPFWGRTHAWSEIKSKMIPISCRQMDQKSYIIGWRS